LDGVGGRDAEFTLYAASLIDPEEFAADRQVHERLHEPMRPWWAGGSVLNFLGVGDTTPEQICSAYPPEIYSRLAAIKADYDPQNIFRVNHNIPPQSI